MCHADPQILQLLLFPIIIITIIITIIIVIIIVIVTIGTLIRYP